MFEELRALVTLAERRSMERAAHGLRLTPSAFSRRIQRLEAELGITLLDRHFKPPRLTPAGLEVLERGRAILSSVSDLKASASGDISPGGPFRLGLSHALAQPEISGVILELGRRFPHLRPTLSNDTTPQLLSRLNLGELDAALIVLPANAPPPRDLKGVRLAREAMRVVQARNTTQPRASRPSDFYRRSWVLNPAGCLVREEIKARVRRLGAELVVAAELHNPELQLALIAGNVGVGVARAAVLRNHPLRSRLRVLRHPGFEISVGIAFYRARHLGAREPVALELQRMLARHFKRDPA